MRGPQISIVLSGSEDGSHYNIVFTLYYRDQCWAHVMSRNVVETIYLKMKQMLSFNDNVTFNIALVNVQNSLPKPMQAKSEVYT